MSHARWNEDAFRHLPRARGAVDIAEVMHGELHLAGWLLHPQLRIDSVTVVGDGRKLGEVPLNVRPDVEAAFPCLPPGLYCGFDFRRRLDPSDPLPTHYRLIGNATGRPAIQFPWTRPDGAPPPPAPEPVLMQRVSGNTSAKSFATAGFQGAMDLLSALSAHRVPDRPIRLLDWGCGSGRVTAHLSRLLPDAEIHGCDIDAEAIRWCRSALSGAAFEVCGMEPPLPYPPELFDVVVATSVMTHLDRRRQLDWLSEIRRVLKHEGLFLASTHGEFAAAFQPGMLERLTTSGIIDELRDTALDGIAPPDYYRGVYQTRAYTSENWGRCLRVREQIPAGLLGFQDLVVLQKAARLNCDQAI
jgi:SAM-dependent methyltransferase